MDTPELLAVAADWSAWEKPPRSSVRRRVQLPSALRPELALVVQGVRRCGKSTLLTQMIDRYQLDRRHCLFLNFEDPRLAGVLDHTTLQQLVAGFEARIGPQPATFFFDEIQRVDGWQRWLRMQLDLPRGHRFVVTGSNAHLLSGELASQLTGRHLRAELQPFDFDEFRAMRPGDSVEDYLAFGGFPAAVQSDERDQLLRTYFDDIVERDIRERVGARSSRSLRQLVQMLFESAGAELSVRRISAALDLSTDTTSLYLDAVANAYLAFPCPFFAWSTRKQALRNKKWYPIDTGLRRATIVRTGEDRGKQLECATFLLLRQRYRNVGYWRGSGEVDFVVEHAGKPIPVQVSLDGPEERHHRALDEFYATHPQSEEAVFVDLHLYADGIPQLPGQPHS
ncbi:MAG: ATP-binding protein [Planctomycetota bacterium]